MLRFCTTEGIFYPLLEGDGSTNFRDMRFRFILYYHTTRLDKVPRTLEQNRSNNCARGPAAGRKNQIQLQVTDYQLQLTLVAVKQERRNFRACCSSDCMCYLHAFRQEFALVAITLLIHQPTKVHSTVNEAIQLDVYTGVFFECCCVQTNYSQRISLANCTHWSQSYCQNPSSASQFREACRR